MFQCTWCPTLNRCSTGTDRKRQEWIQAGCERSQLRESAVCPAAGTKGNNYSSQQQVTPSPTNSNNEPWISSSAEIEKNATKSTVDVKKSALAHINPEQTKQSHTSFVLGILLPIVVMASLVMWVFYAYRNPHTKSGQLLIQVRKTMNSIHLKKKIGPLINLLIEMHMECLKLKYKSPYRSTIISIHEICFENEISYKRK